MSKLEVLLSTMGDRIASIPFNPAAFPKVHFRIFHQSDTELPPPARFSGHGNVTIHPLVGQRGLSKSRNSALDAAREDICLLADDDVTYHDDLASRITNAFDTNPDADIIAFEATTPDGQPLKCYPAKEKWLSLLNTARVSSIEIAFRRRRIMDAGLRFDDRFGLGGRYRTGEEFIFLADAIRGGLRVRHVPIRIAVHPLHSSGKNHDTDTIVARGAMMARVFGSAAFLIDIAFTVKKYREYRKELSFLRYLLLLWRGSRLLMQEGRLLS